MPYLRFLAWFFLCLSHEVSKHRATFRTQLEGRRAPRNRCKPAWSAGAHVLGRVPPPPPS